MSTERESIFKASFRSFFVSTFAILGICFAIFLIIAGFLKAVSKLEDEIEPTNKIVMLPDANGIRDKLDSDTPLILQIDINGIIGLKDLKKEKLQTLLLESREGELEEDRVKGILLFINSPGGGSIDTDGIYQALMSYKKQFNVPVYAYIEGLCASGGYYIAASADKVYASDSSLIGSIGVLLSTAMNFTKLMETVGIQAVTITSGKDKDGLNPFRPWKPDETVMFQHLTDSLYKQFVNIVVAGRPNIDRDKLIEVYGAKVFPADEALTFGYVDKIGVNRNDALRDLVVVCGIKESEKYQVIRLEDKEWLTKLIEGSSMIFNGTMKHQVQFSGEIDPSLQNQLLYLYRFE